MCTRTYIIATLAGAYPKKVEIQIHPGVSTCHAKHYRGSTGPATRDGKRLPSAAGGKRAYGQYAEIDICFTVLHCKE